MRLRNILGSSAAIGLSFCCIFATSQTAKNEGIPVIGVGAYPLSFADASAWFAQAANDHEKIVTVMVYFHGTPGWTSQIDDFKSEFSGDPATLHLKAANTPVDVKYWRGSDEVEIFGKKYKRSANNVFFLSKIDSPSPVVTPVGEHDLAFGPDDIPSVTLLRRDSKVWAAVTGLPEEAHPLGREVSASKEALSWDKEGLRLLLTGEAAKEEQGCALFQKAADQGYAPAQYRLGYCYEGGRGKKQDYSVANDWYEKAGNQGYVDAQYKLAHSYRTGRGTKINLPLAMVWYKKAGESHDNEALSNVGWMYATGQGAPVNQTEAYKWFLEAAKVGDAASQLEVGERLTSGNGVSKDLLLAYSWFLVLKVDQQKFPPDDWKRVEALMTPLEKQLDSAAKQQAEVRSHEWMMTIAQAEMQAYAKQ